VQRQAAPQAARDIVFRARDVRKVYQMGGEWQAFVVKGGRAERRVVPVGHRSTELAEVLPADGEAGDSAPPALAEGDEVILFPSDEIDDGVRVSPR
jgi:hypothetical protein